MSHQARILLASLRQSLLRAAGCLALPVLVGAGLLAQSAAPASADVDCRSEPAAGIVWQGCNKSSIMLGGSDLSGANLTEADFSATDLRGANLQGANLEKAVLIRTALGGANAAGANFARAEAYRAGFQGVAGKGINFSSAELQRADFTGADLEGADFGKSELGRAIFDDALITGTNFVSANLSRAHLEKARFAGPIDFSGAFLYFTRIEGIDLSAAKGLTQAQIDQACGDEGTVLPRGLKPSASWPCKQ
ncbi:MAG: pentapeptide repeat-containing protein [Rhizobiaceae bacterium]|nr:pentapeptide repeat-containing protein [Rhizobiaceae bacterium]